MTKAEQTRLMAWRCRVLRHALHQIVNRTTGPVRGRRGIDQREDFRCPSQRGTWPHAKLPRRSGVAATADCPC